MSARETHSDLWAGAVAEYEKQTERKIDRDYAFREWQSVDDLKDTIERETERFNTFRSEHRRIFSALASCIKPLEPIFKIIQQGIGNTPYAPASVVFGAASHLLQACDSVSKAYDGIEELFERMKDITVRLKEYDAGGMESSLRAKMTDILAYFLDIIGKAEACIKRKRIKQWVRSAFTKFDDISSAVNKLKNYVEAELGLVIALSYRRLGDVQASTADIHNAVNLGKAKTDELLSMQRSDRQRAFSEADERKLSDSLINKTTTVDEMAREHVGNVEKLTKGTGLWIKDDPMLQTWEQEKAPILWVLGKPGVGKTMLAAKTIAMLQDMYPQHPDIPTLTSVSYLYFKDDNPALQDCAQMLKTAAFQITRANDRFKKHVIATISKNQECLASVKRIWQQLFLDFFADSTLSPSATSLAFIIVDGVDEAPKAERAKFLHCLADLVNRRKNDQRYRIQVAVFARPSVQEDPGFENVGFWTQDRKIVVTPEKNSVDIETYTRQKLSDVTMLKMLKRRKKDKEYQALAKHIYHSVHSRSQGMFLWAKLTFDQIQDLPSPEAIKESLQKVPKGLDEMLYHVFKRLEVHEQMDQSYLRYLISWVLCAHRPLYVSELFVLIFTIANHHYYMIKDHLKARYSSLFDVTGPFAGLEQYEEDVRRFTDDSASERDDFEFLTGEDSECSDNGADEAGSLAEENVSAGSALNQEDTDSIPSHWHQTTVTFAHARIRDYLTIEGNPSKRRWNDCTVVPADLNLTRLSIVHHLLDVLSTDIADEYSVVSLKEYARTFWVKHLEELDFARIDIPNAVKLARKLLGVFQDGQRMLEMLESSLQVGYEFVETWFSTSTYSSLVRRIITEHLDALNGREQDWALSIAKSPRGLFQPLISACARKWLTKNGWDDIAYLKKSEPEVCIMYAFSLLTDEGIKNDSESMSNIFDGMWNIPLDAIESIASVELLQRTEHYYAGIAWIMMEAGDPDYTEQAVEYTERAIEHFQKALELKPGGWVAMEGLARCYGDNLHEFETAIQYMEDAMLNLPQTEDLEGIEFYLQARISDWTLHLGNDQESVGRAQIAYEASRGYCYGTGYASDSSILRSVKHYIEALYRTENYDGIIELLYEVDNIGTCKQDTSLWTSFIQAQYYRSYNNLVFDKIGNITRVVKKDALQSFMKASIKKSINLDADSIADDRSVWLAKQAASWQYSYALQPEESIDLWESIVALIDQSNGIVQQSQAPYRTRAAEFLSMMYFDAAKTARNNGGDASAHVSKLENLANHKQGSKRYYRASYPALVFGMWLHEYEQAEEEVWRACIRPSIKQALYLLSDEDPWNDQRAYAQLGQALLLAGDTLNASIALGVTTKPLDEQSNSPQQSGDEENVNREILELVPTAAKLAKLHLDVDAEQAVERQVGDPSATDSPDRQDTHLTKGEAVSASTLDTAQGNGEEMEGEIATSDRDDDKSTVSTNPKYAGFDYMWSCDGPCNSAQQSYAEIYFCRVCNDVCFCEKCIQLVRNDEMPFRRCAKDHPFVRAFPMIEEARRVTDALVERRFEVQQAWLEGLRKVWED